MALNTSACLLLFLSSIVLAFTGLTHAVAVSDSNITLVCSTTNEPDFCQKTLKLDPTWNTTDIHGLGKIALKQAIDRAKYVPQYLSSIIARSDSALAAKYQACSMDYDAIIDGLIDAEIADSKDGDLIDEAAFVSVKTAFEGIGESLYRFKQPPKDLSEFTGYSQDIQTLCQVFMTVVSLLGHGE